MATFVPAVRVRVDTREWQRAFRRVREQTPRAVSRALNRTIQQVQTVAVRAVAKDTKLAQKDVRKSMRIVRATVTHLKALLHVSGRRIPLIAFRARGPEPSRGRGRVTADTGRGRRAYPGAFIATVGAGHRGVFKRRTVKRLPIDELRGPSLPRVFVQTEIEQQLQQTAAAKLPGNVKHEIEFLLRGQRRAAR